MTIGTSLLDCAARGAASGRAAALGCGAAGEKSIIELWPGDTSEALVGGEIGDGSAMGSDVMDLQRAHRQAWSARSSLEPAGWLVG